MKVRPHTVYTGRSTNWLAIGLSTALAVPFVALGVGSNGSWTAPGYLIPMLLVFAVFIVNLLTASSVRSTAGPNGVIVNFGVFGWPRFRYPLERIQHAEAITIPPNLWSWGIYWSPRRGLMLTLRKGAALRLTLINGRKVTISTPHPDAAVAAIHDLQAS